MGALGQEAEYNAALLIAQQEDDCAGQLLEVSNEEELARVPQWHREHRQVRRPRRHAARSNYRRPSARRRGRATRSKERSTGEAAGSRMDAESGEVNQEDEQFEMARRVVRLTSAAAQDVATAPPAAPPQLVGELSVFRAAARRAAAVRPRPAGDLPRCARLHYGRRLRRLPRRVRVPRPVRDGGTTATAVTATAATGPAMAIAATDTRGLRLPAARLCRPPSLSRVPSAVHAARPRQPGFRWVAVPIGAPPRPSREPPPPPPEGPPRR